MGLRIKSAGTPVVETSETEESDEEFEERIYAALMECARRSSAKLRSALGSCVMLATPYEKAPEIVRDAIAEFIAEAEL